MDGTRLLIWTALGAGATLLSARLLRARRRIRFTDKVVVIAGGSRGLGLALARQLAREGARLVLIARDADELERARAQLAAQAASVVTIPCDVSSRVEVDETMARVLDRFGRIDVLFNVAGIMQFGPIEHMDRVDFEMAMNVHLWGPFHAMMAAIPAMIRQGGGRIVNITSVGGMIAVPHAAPYCTSKFALVGLSDTLRAELRRHGIRVTTVCPGLMRTGSHVNAMFKGKHQAEYAWFAIGNALPLASMSVRRAARRIIEACRYGDAHATLGWQTRAAIVTNVLFPGLTGELMALMDRLLPGLDTERGDALRSGWDSRSRWAPSILTYRSDRAVAGNNELRGHSPAHLLGERR